MIIYDFDGVLVDSIQEIALSVYNLTANCRLTRTDQLPPEFVSLFYSNRHLTLAPLRTVWLAKWVLQSLEEGKAVDTVLSREDFLANHVDHNDTTSTSDFYAVRQWLMEEQPESWLELNKPFEVIWQATKEIDPNKYFILTYKNRAAVKKICAYYDLEISDSRLFTGDKGLNKSQNILELDKIENAALNYIFLDDAIENLEALYPVLPQRIHPALAVWGYNNELDQLRAQKHGFELVTQAEFVRKYLSE